MIGVHILGSGYGESIVLELPNGKIGVVDTYTHRVGLEDAAEFAEANPTIRFLEQYPTNRLAFLAITHAHEDHCRGLYQLLEYFTGRIDELWLFQGFDSVALDKYLSTVSKYGMRFPIEPIKEELPGSFAVEYMQARNKVVEAIKS